ncbi:hypothetical protein Tco_0004185 [Tanacetum coccineum]
MDNQEESGESEHRKKEFESFNRDTPIGKEFDEFYVFEKDEMEGAEEKKFEMIGTPSERAESLHREFNNWAEKGFVNTSVLESVMLAKK